jgi:hypothetical protein
MAAYATAEEYRADTGDTTSDETRIQNMLEQQSAKLRALVGITSTTMLTDDETSLCRFLVVDAVRKALAPSILAGIGEVGDATQASWSADGFSASATFTNPSGSAYFDRATLKALKRLLGVSQRIGTIEPSYGDLEES